MRVHVRPVLSNGHGGPGPRAPKPQGTPNMNFDLKPHFGGISQFDMFEPDLDRALPGSLVQIND